MSVLLYSFQTPDNLAFTAFMNRGRETDVIYLDCKKHLTLSHMIAFTQPERHGFDGWTVGKELGK